MMLFANRLKQLRVKNDLRQRQMSAVLEIDSGLYSKIERGERRAKKEQVLQLACFLHVDEKRIAHILASGAIQQCSFNRLSNCLRCHANGF